MSSVPDSASQQHQSPVYTDDEIDLRQLARALWRYRWVVVALGLIGALGGVGVSLLSTKYVAEGLFLAPSLKVASFKQYEIALGNEERLQKFIELSNLRGTQSEELLQRLVEKPWAMSEAVRPAFALTGREAKAYDIKVEDTDLLGIQLLLERERLSDESPIQRLADYVRHTMIEVDLRESMLSQCLNYQSREQELRNEQIQSDFSVAQARQRSGRLRELIDSIPGAAVVDSRQVVSLEGGGERFLSPTAQLVAVEVEIADAELARVRRERERLAAGLKKDYYCQSRDLQQQALTGQAFLIRLGDIQSKVFEEQDMTHDIVEQTANEIALQRQAWTSHYLERARFVVSPDGGEQRRRKPGLALGSGLGGVLGGFLGLILALGLAWWHDNREVVLAADA